MIEMGLDSDEDVIVILMELERDDNLCWNRDSSERKAGTGR